MLGYSGEGSANSGRHKLTHSLINVDFISIDPTAKAVPCSVMQYVKQGSYYCMHTYVLVVATRLGVWIFVWQGQIEFGCVVLEVKS